MNKTIETDSDLIQLFLKGEQSGIERLFNRHRDRLFTYIFFLVKKQEIAEDIFQDTFLKAFHSIKAGKYKDDGRFISWISRIAHNLVIDYFREQKKHKMVSGNEYDEQVFIDTKVINIEDEIVSSQILKDIKKLLEYLPKDQREVIVMRNYLDMSFKEISKITGVSINTSLGRMRYAIINLRKLIEEHKVQIKI
jgi:RNA polymerase sigma-70 factor (ECF subfamily)